MTERATLGTLLNKTCKKGCMFGGELEVESNTKLPIIDTGTWKTERDPSLRSSLPYEYTTRSPIPFVGVERAVSSLLTTLNDKEQSEPIKDSATTSWHIHLNALELTATEMMTRVFLYWLLEPIIIKHCGIKREQNTFALQLKDSYHTLRRFDTSFYTSMITEPKYISRSSWFSQEQRYSSQNLCALVKFGSIEYRAMSGTLDKDEIMQWINTLTSIWTQPYYTNPSDLLCGYYDLGIEGLCKQVLRDDGVEYKKFLSTTAQEEADENAMALLVVDDNKLFSWDQWEEKIAKQAELRELEQARSSDEDAPSTLRNRPARPSGVLARSIEDLQYRARVEANRNAARSSAQDFYNAVVSNTYATTSISTGPQ